LEGLAEKSQFAVYKVENQKSSWFSSLLSPKTRESKEPCCKPQSKSEGQESKVKMAEDWR
jgi:hypothetical protein